MQAKKRLGTSWSPKDVARMRALARSGKSAREAAEALQRSRGSVAFKAMRLGVHFSAIAQPAGVQKRRFRKRRKAA